MDVIQKNVTNEKSHFKILTANLRKLTKQNISFCLFNIYFLNLLNNNNNPLTRTQITRRENSRTLLYFKV